VTSPQSIKEVRPNYTGDAVRAKIQGVVATILFPAPQFCHSLRADSVLL
jgi:hypothetical protein